MTLLDLVSSPEVEQLLGSLCQVLGIRRLCHASRYRLLLTLLDIGLEGAEQGYRLPLLRGSNGLALGLEQVERLSGLAYDDNMNMSWR